MGWSSGGAQYVGSWEAVPPTLSTALGPVSYEARTPVPADWKLRGTGLHGPENGEGKIGVVEPPETAATPAHEHQHGGLAGVLPHGGDSDLVDVWAYFLHVPVQLVGHEVPHGARPLPMGTEAS